MDPINKIAFVVNKQKNNAETFAEQLAQKVESLGVASKISYDPTLPPAFLKGQDACCTIGGDGTLLGVATQAVKYQIPSFGINRGKLGFLATFSPDEALQQFESLLAGNYIIQNRTTLQCTTEDGEQIIALNDVVVKKTTPYRLLELEVFCNDELVTPYACDGLIFTSPTGSTAYNLSAGGPIIYPGSCVFAMTPICPHTLSNRSVIFASTNTIKIYLKHLPSQAFVTLDGYTRFGHSNTFPIEVGISSKTLPLLQTPNYSHFRILRNKLSWGD